jgi:NAD(P)-dependent dehydrogenase (short-subunit alcohol dehydrogenase family)
MRRYAAVARLAAARGFGVAVNYLRDRVAAEQVVRDACAAGGCALAVAGDVAQEDEVAHIFEIAERELGPIHGLVNSAGVTGGFARVEHVASQTLARVLANGSLRWGPCRTRYSE